jgi:hypothetical protein
MDKAQILAAPQTLVVPGRGEVEIGQRSEYKAAFKALKEYDSRLLLARHAQTDEWVVFLEHGPVEMGGAPYPILGLGRELPHPDDIKKRLFQVDAVRNGEEILRQINATNTQLRKEKAAEADDATGQLAEGIESFLNAKGKTPYHRSLRKLDPKQQAGKD